MLVPSEVSPVVTALYQDASNGEDTSLCDVVLWEKGV
jgi:hypothetical protein